MANHTLDVYNRVPIQFVRGEGVWLYDAKGDRYLDAFAGIAVTILGHKNPVILQAINDQTAKIIHTSNLVEIPEQIALSNLLVSICGFDAQVFFSNSGAEAVETAIKASRLYGHSKNIAEPKIIVMDKAFHGRTMGGISAGGSEKARKGFDPLLPGFVRVPFNDVSAVRAAIKADPSIVAILVEPIQGESGVNVPSADYLSQLRAICDEHQLLLMLDEIQTGMGRTGKFFAYEHAQIQPDVITLAKGLANGLPIGATIIRAPYYKLFHQGSHGSTFGGNPLSCAVANATLNELKRGGWADNAGRQGEKLLKGLQRALADNPHVIAVRGKGLMIGIELDKEAREILAIGLRHKVMMHTAGTHVIRLLPPLIYSDQDTALLLDQIPKIIAEYYE